MPDEVQSDKNNKPPKGFYWLAGVALLWNLAGFGAYIAQVTMTPETLAALPDADRQLYQNLPSWATGAFAIAVTAGVLGCLLLLLRSTLALPVLVVSLLAVVVQNYNSFVLMDALSIVGGGAAASAAVVMVGAYLIWYALDAKRKGWISR